MTTQREKNAYHEAGHAAVARALGAEARPQLDPPETYVEWPEHKRTVPVEEAAHDDAVIAFVGLVLDPEYADGDMRDLLASLERLGLNPVELVEETRSIIVARWDEIDAEAQELLAA